MTQFAGTSKLIMFGHGLKKSELQSWCSFYKWVSIDKWQLIIIVVAIFTNLATRYQHNHTANHTNDLQYQQHCTNKSTPKMHKNCHKYKSKTHTENTNDKKYLHISFYINLRIRNEVPAHIHRNSIPLPNAGPSRSTSTSTMNSDKYRLTCDRISFEPFDANQFQFEYIGIILNMNSDRLIVVDLKNIYPSIASDDELLGMAASASILLACSIILCCCTLYCAIAWKQQVFSFKEGCVEDCRTRSTKSNAIHLENHNSCFMIAEFGVQNPTQVSEHDEAIAYFKNLTIDELKLQVSDLPEQIYELFKGSNLDGNIVNQSACEMNGDSEGVADFLVEFCENVNLKQMNLVFAVFLDFPIAND